MANNFDSSGKGAMQPLLPHETRKPTYKKRARLALTVGAIALFGTSCIYLSQKLPGDASVRTASVQEQVLWEGASQKVIPPGISSETFNRGLDKCQAIFERSISATNTTRQRHRNPRAGGAGQILIKNGRIWLGDKYLDGDILIEDGLITAVDKHIKARTDAKVIDAAGRVVTPGLVDMHSHMTVDSFPGLAGLEDTNESSDPATPYVRVIDAMNPSDPALKIVASGGITTSLILPGSSNSMGGEAAVIKLRPVPSLSVEEMLITWGVSKEDQEVVWRYMKMACGENPKANYGALQNKMPMTRLGEGYLFRQHFEEAQLLKQSQDDWCDAATKINQTSPARIRLTTGFPESLKSESLVALLRRETKLNVHCYLPHDFEAMIHHSQEFDFEIAAFHHALSAWQATEIIKRANSNITIATFGGKYPNMWGYKTEAFNTNVYAPQILAKAGIPVAFKSDHPVMNSRDVLHEAQKAYHYGFDEHLSLAALTSVPANSLGVGHRIGSIDVGKDADIVVWANHPLRLGARPKHVIVDGVELDFEKSWTKAVEEILEDGQTASVKENQEKPQPEMSLLPPRPLGSMKLEDHGLDNPMSFDEACDPSVNSFVLRNISQLYMNAKEVYDGHKSGQSLHLVVQNGTVVCAGPNCDRDNADWPHGSPVFEMGGATVIPGIVSACAPLGLMGIQMESSTLDGYARNDLSDPQLDRKIVRAIDGLKLGDLRLKKAYRAGVVSSISQPLSSSELLGGLSVAFGIGAENTVLDSNDTIIKEETALHFEIFHSGGYPDGETKMTISQQIAAIRELLTTSVEKDASTNVFARAAQGKLPVVVQTHDKDEIASIVQMKRQLYERSNQKYEVQFIILGGAEAHLVADHLKQSNVPVILTPARCYPNTWQARHCLSGPPLTAETGLDVLLRHGVRVGVASTDADNGDARNLIFEAGWNLAHNSHLSPADAIGLVTWNMADIFGLQSESLGIIQKGGKANFVAYNSNPFEFGSGVLMVNGGGRSGPLCFPKQI